MTEQEQLIEDIASFTHDPYSFALYAFPWGEEGTELERHTGPREWQAEAFKDIAEHLKNPETRHQPLMVARASGHGIGKAQRIDDFIDTPQGRKVWGDISVGDEVFGINGSAVRVSATKNYTSAPMYRVTFDDRSYLDVSSGHLWNVRGRNERRNGLSSWRTMETIEILRQGVKRKNGVSMARQWEIPTQGAVDFPFKPIPADAYMLGVWIGDGGKNKSLYTKPDNEIFEKLSGLGVNVERRDRYAVALVGQHSALKATGLYGLGSHERYIPDLYKYNSIETRNSLLCGILDTDGEVHASGSIGYSTTSKRLADDVIWLARSLGCKAMMHPSVKKPSYRDRDGNKVPGRDCWRVTINAPFNPFCVAHKKNAYKPSEDRYVKRWIEGIEYIGDMPAMCISIDDSTGLYQARDFIVTHNSAFISMLINWGMATCEDCKVVVTANTENQLRTKTWPEVIKWSNLAITKDWFTTTATAMYSNDPGHDKRWRADAIPWSEHNTEAFAGLHNERKRIIVVFDEASNIADLVTAWARGRLLHLWVRQLPMLTR
ncbi:homing endonuclease-like protein [Samsonia erythrinae]|uniref:Homing endonuclease-like protein n=1 Tax=Samsonia erythrinae TaxID=160434 RepID=A0A4R3VJU2_9GAMM|nr:homing endonuclease-like protein [Samsonia erythrinae]